MAIIRGIPNTIHFWQEPKKEVIAIIRQLCKPTAFLTLSASEVHWDSLIELLERLPLYGDTSLCRQIDNMTFLERVELWKTTLLLVRFTSTNSST
ncbi:hypothetical protein HPB49_003639 [Dermacentor silvarum]|uniref:Uncharacterized protein n=1 Tax=Dermacentor silvarum TaxID=543639 RepID=A0ACB8CPE3_DERSI|nr:hypothetical protein HPB49_003639 [Dermacentor silvarum]